MSVAGLLREIGADAPSGENLEYDPAFTELELAATPGEERQVGSTIIEAAEPDWRDVTAKATAVLERSHDLRAAVMLANAQVRLKGLPGLADVTAYMRGALEQFWDTCHPQLDADDDDDPTMRVNAVRGLADGQGVLRALRLTPLTQSRGFGQFNLRDVLIAEGDMPAPAGVKEVDLSTLNAAAQDTPPEVLAASLEAARGALADVRAISRQFDERTPGLGPDLDPVIRSLGRIVKFLQTASGEEEPAADAGPANEGPAEADLAAHESSAARAGVSAPGTIASAADVAAALDRIMAYYTRYEPSSPVPILLARAKRLVNADFLTIMQDMAPNGVESVRMIGGIKDQY